MYKEKESINASEVRTVFLASDKNYFIGLKVTILSLLYSSKTTYNYHIYVMQESVSASSQAKLRAMVIDINPINKLEFCEINLRFFENARKLNGSYLAYARLLMPNVVKADKVLYLDVDILVCKDLDELFEIDIKDYYAAAVVDKGIRMLSNDRFSKEEIVDRPYFNSGVMLVNLKRWRSEQIVERSMKLIKRYGTIITFHDQTVLNHLIGNKILYLDDSFNLNSIYWNEDSQTSVIHYQSRKKPWKVKYTKNRADYLWSKFNASVSDEKFFNRTYLHWNNYFINPLPIIPASCNLQKEKLIFIKNHLVVQFSVIYYLNYIYLKLSSLFFSKAKSEIINLRIKTYTQKYKLLKSDSFSKKKVTDFFYNTFSK